MGGMFNAELFHGDAMTTRRQRRFLAACYPNGTVATGSQTGFDLYQSGFLHEAKSGRYGLTAAGTAEIEKHPESKWNLRQPAPRTGFNRR